MILQKNRLAFPEIDDFIDFLNKNLSYNNHLVLDIIRKASKYELSPRQIDVLIKEWENIQNNKGESPTQINSKKFPYINELREFMSKTSNYFSSDEIIYNIMSQFDSRILSDKQINVLINKYKYFNSEFETLSQKDLEKLRIAFHCFYKLGVARNEYLNRISRKINEILESNRINKKDDEYLKNMTHKYKKMIFSSLFN